MDGNICRSLGRGGGDGIALVFLVAILCGRFRNTSEHFVIYSRNGVKKINLSLYSTSTPRVTADAYIGRSMAQTKIGPLPYSPNPTLRLADVRVTVTVTVDPLP